MWHLVEGVLRFRCAAPPNPPNSFSVRASFFFFKAELLKKKKQTGTTVGIEI